MTTPSPELSIRMARAAFNRALSEGDLAAVSRVLSPRATLVTGTDSAVLGDRKTQLQVWKRDFASDGRTVYVRTTETVVVSPSEPIAKEYGTWRGVIAPTGLSEALGCYSAKWRKIADDWVIEAEIFVTLG